MDIEKLLDPYRENGRTLALQKRFLKKYMVPDDFIESSIMMVYDAVDRGRKFEPGIDLDGKLQTAGHYLDLFLLQTALDLVQKDQIDRINLVHGQLREQWNNDLNTLAKMQNESWWSRMKKAIKW